MPARRAAVQRLVQHTCRPVPHHRRFQVRPRPEALEERWAPAAGFDAVALSPAAPMAAQAITAPADSPLSGTGVPVQPYGGLAFTYVKVGRVTDARFGPSGNGSAQLISYSASINWGDRTPLDNLTNYWLDSGFGTGSVDQFSVVGTHTYAQDGTYTVQVHVGDSTGDSTDFTTTATVTDAPKLTVRNINATQGRGFSGVIASFSDPDPNATAGDFTAVINWGFGFPPPYGPVRPQWIGVGAQGTITRDSSGLFRISGSYVYPFPGTYPITVTVIHSGGASFSASGTATVAPLPLAITATPIRAIAGATVTRTLASVSQQGTFWGLGFTPTVDWGDGQTSGAQLVANTFGVVKIVGTHTYARPGQYTVKITIQQGTFANSTNPPPIVVTSSATVAPAPSVVNAHALDVHVFEGVFGYRMPFAYFDVNISPFDLPTALADGLFQASITWTNGVQTRAIIESQGYVTPSAGGIGLPRFLVRAETLYPEEGVFPAWVTVRPLGGAPIGLATKVFVSDAPLLAPIKPPPAISGLAGSALGRSTVVSGFTDASIVSAALEFAATIDWGDGSAPAQGIIANAPNAEWLRLPGTRYVVTGGHLYAQPGTYTVHTTVHDKGGASLSLTNTVKIAPPPARP